MKSVFSGYNYLIFLQYKRTWNNYTTQYDIDTTTLKDSSTNRIYIGTVNHQCGMIYKPTDASLLSSGIQPFVVQIRFNGYRVRKLNLPPPKMTHIVVNCNL